MVIATSANSIGSSASGLCTVTSTDAIRGWFRQLEAIRSASVSIRFTGSPLTTPATERTSSA